jgi:hypothetical protein
MHGAIPPLLKTSLFYRDNFTFTAVESLVLFRAGSLQLLIYVRAWKSLLHYVMPLTHSLCFLLPYFNLIKCYSDAENIDGLRNLACVHCCFRFRRFECFSVPSRGVVPHQACVTTQQTATWIFTTAKTSAVAVRSHLKFIHRGPLYILRYASSVYMPERISLSPYPYVGHR